MTTADPQAVRYTGEPMSTPPVPHLQPLAPLIGRWRTSGTVLDEHGADAASISGLDTYSWLPGRHWIVHEVDVVMDGRRTQALELIGGHDEASGGWQMHAFDTADQPGLMRLTVAEPGLLLLDGDEVRSWLRIQTADAGRMTARWERRVDGQWLRWMDMRFEREHERDGTVW